MLRFTYFMGLETMNSKDDAVQPNASTAAISRFGATEGQGQHHSVPYWQIGIIALVLAGLSVAGLYVFAPQYLSPQLIALLGKVIPEPAKENYSEADVLNFIRSSILPSIVKIECSENEAGTEMSSGTGYFFHDSKGQPVVGTNAHVVTATDGQYYGCSVYFPYPNSGAFYESMYFSGNGYMFHKNVAMIELNEVVGIDYAILSLSEPGKDSSNISFPYPPQKPDVLAENKFCTSERTIQIGEKIYMAGYPAVAGDSLTLSEGIVSGFEGEFGENIKISASTNKGNSGGIIMSADDGCILGITTAATFAEGGNFGYALSFSHIESFLANLVDRAPYTPPLLEDEIELEEQIQFAELSMHYPSQWNLVDSGAQTPAQDFMYSIKSPREHALDIFLENVTITITPKATEEDLDAALSEELTLAESLDKERLTATLTIGESQDVYAVVYDDPNAQYFASPLRIISASFYRAGNLYQVSAAVDIHSPYFNEYVRLIKAMLESMTIVK